MDNFRNNLAADKEVALNPWVAFTGVLVGVVVTYCVIYFSELLQLSHAWDYSLMSTLTALGIPVLCFGWYEAENGLL